MQKKYKFTGKTIQHLGIELKQIQRLSDGLVGGYIEKEENLRHLGECFVFENAQVFGNARVLENAQVYGNAKVLGYARVSGNAKVSGNAEVYGDARIYGNARVWGNAKVYGDARVYGNAEVSKPQDCINITGLRYNITLCPTFGHVGCKEFNIFELHDIKHEDYHEDYKDQISEEEFNDIKLIILTHYEYMLSKQ